MPYRNGCGPAFGMSDDEINVPTCEMAELSEPLQKSTMNMARSLTNCIGRQRKTRDDTPAFARAEGDERNLSAKRGHRHQRQ
jgi:hypothetical protein